jgi:hypothetical protein
VIGDQQQYLLSLALFFGNHAGAAEQRLNLLMGSWPVPQSRIIGLAQVALQTLFSNQGN